MNPKLWPLALVLVLAACHSAPSLEPDPTPQASDLTAEQLIAKSNAARGGEQRLAAVQFVKLTGQWSTNAAKARPVTVMIAPGNYLRRIELASGPPSIKAIQGQESWEINPQNNVLKPAPMLARDASRFRRLADPQGPLVNPQAKGNKIEVIGKHAWRTFQVYKLKVTYPDGGVGYLYLDAQSFLPVRSVGTMYVAQVDEDADLEILYEDYRDVDGVKWPFKETSFAPQARFTQTISWDKVEIDRQPLDESVFAAPKS